MADLGGDLSHVKAALVERFVWLEALLQNIEHDIAIGAVSKNDALGKWVQGLNALTGMAKVLGIERRSNVQPWVEPANGDQK